MACDAIEDRSSCTSAPDRSSVYVLACTVCWTAAFSAWDSCRHTCKTALLAMPSAIVAAKVARALSASSLLAASVASWRSQVACTEVSCASRLALLVARSACGAGCEVCSSQRANMESSQRSLARLHCT